MKKTVSRALALIVPAVFTVTTLAAAPASAEPIPDGWVPTYSQGLVSVTGRQVGRLPGRLGNQHVTEVWTYDEEETIRGEIRDWWCPAGAIAPKVAWGEVETPCTLKGAFYFDQHGAASTTNTWAPNLRYMTFRGTDMPDWESLNGAAVPRRGSDTFSLRLKATGAQSQEVHDDGGILYAIRGREDATVVGGQFFGTPWLEMASVEVEGNSIGLWTYYEATV
ncbi:hypothetical protein [Nocardioides sp.]|uniref:hypothetical protein n=1 Tax=Nocardioides sp. TaxID=35761 RepID=UPI003D143C32